MDEGSEGTAPSTAERAPAVGTTGDAGVASQTQVLRDEGGRGDTQLAGQTQQEENEVSNIV